MPAFIDVRLVEEVRLPYQPGAEAALAGIDAAFAAAWDVLAASFPGVRLDPLFEGVDARQIAAMTDAARVRSGEEPPDLFAWFAIPCDETVAEQVLAIVQALPFVLEASRRLKPFPAASVPWGTNPETERAAQILPAPRGVDAIWAWNIPGGTAAGVRIADIEGGWRLTHEELRTPRIRAVSVFGSEDVDHGTAVAGIVVGPADNGVGIVGIAPLADLALITEKRGPAIAFNIAAAIVVAAAAVDVDGIILIELAFPFFAAPEPAPDVLVEIDRAVQAAIRFVALFGIVVVEPAGNGGVPLDNVPAFQHTRPGSPTFIDSHAIVVGAGELVPPSFDTWARTFSSFGSRVDCFAAGAGIRAPSAAADDSYQDFGGTSGASAIIAGVVATMQGMARAATGSVLSPGEIKRIFSDPNLTTTIPPGANGGIGGMPDLRKIAKAQSWTRAVPVGAAAIDGSSLVVVHLDDDNHLARRMWTFFGGWGPPLEAVPGGGRFELTPGQPSVMVRHEQDPLVRIVHDALLPGPGGLHHLWWDTHGQIGDITREIAPRTGVAQGSSVASVAASEERVAICAVNPEGLLQVFTGDPRIHFVDGLGGPVLIDADRRYRRADGPAMVSRAPALADVVAIDDSGTLVWFNGTTVATIGTGWSGGVADPSGTAFDPGVRPALIVVGELLLAAAVGWDDLVLRVVSIDPVTGTFGTPEIVDDSTMMAFSGPIALGVTSNNLVVLGVDVSDQLRAATRPRKGGDWSRFELVSEQRTLASGGVTAVSMHEVGVMAFGTNGAGKVVSALSRDGVEWSDFEQVS